ncbi:hypothetical protein P3X46_006135 [Hevea brasiliensis]|uniref:Uncharacterized protein n=1 Tax=Hevea brasiliensis TaxID=3981 RepID=A0ABQ9MP94_HEVBR|nr:uncharacterized protein LOC110654138 [Hevea brasiliensis]KAJ9182107.1 hypothetical protein P3X46_006135 [Hevea brasiliensis]
MGSLKSTIHALTLFLSLSFVTCIAFAASGGRMGGNSFSKRSSPSSSSHSSHFSPSNHYYHHHYRHGSRGYSSLSSQNEKMKRGGSEIVDFSTWGVVVITTGMVGAVAVAVYFEYMNNKGSVIMVQVGLTGKAHSLQKELNEIAETTDTGSPNGWQFILTETTSALLRRPKYFISGYSSVKQHWSVENVEKSFGELSREERGKMDMESLVNVNNVKMQRAVTPKASKLGKEYIVVTVLIAAKGSYRVPAITSIHDMKDALRSLNIGSTNLLAVEVLWTAQDGNDTLSEEALLEDYPLLRPI